MSYMTVSRTNMTDDAQKIRIEIVIDCEVVAWAEIMKAPTHTYVDNTYGMWVWHDGDFKPEAPQRFKQWHFAIKRMKVRQHSYTDYLPPEL